MGKLCYFKWYPADAEADATYRAMSDKERGFYHHCLNLVWTNDGLPADPAERARVLGRNRNEADALWGTRVLTRFIPHPLRQGYLTDARLHQEGVQAKQKSVKAAESVKVRYERTTTKTENVALRASDYDYDSSYTVKPDTNPTTGIHSDSLSFNGKISASTSTEKVNPDTGSTTRFNGNSLLDDFGTFLEAVTECELPASPKDLQEKASLEWRRLDFGQKQLAIKGLRDRKAAGEFDDPRYRPHPQNYLKNQTWLRPVRSRLNGNRNGHVSLLEEVNKWQQEGRMK